MDELRILNEAKMPAALDAIDRPILAALPGRLREASATRRMMAIAVVMSLGGGFFVGSAAVHPAVGANPASPLIPASPLAPSALLDSR